MRKWTGCDLRYPLFPLSVIVVLCVMAISAQSSPLVVKGSDGWLFLQQEFNFLNSGPFWGEHAQKTSKASRVDAKDPTPAILAFHKALAEKDITLFVVPVPPKALIYNEFVKDNPKISKWGENLDQYYAILREKGVNVLDLRDEMYRQKKNQKKKLFCKTDTHWSGYGITMAAKLIVKELSDLLSVGNMKYMNKWRNIQIHGDLQQMLSEDINNLETVSIREILNESRQPLKADVLSQVVILGDSHVLVFHDGKDMYAKGAGLSDQLAFALAKPIDVIGVRGSGATPARLNLYRKAQRNAGYWSGKKVVVWCFAAREFTETDGWRILPIEP